MDKNKITLAGYVSELQDSHICEGEQFCTFKITSIRISGTTDTLVCVVSKKMTKGIADGMPIKIVGDIRTYNKDNHLHIQVFVKEVQPFEADKNYVEIEGYLCRKPKYRRTPLGREIADLMVATNRRDKRSAYIPMIAWGRDARYADTLNVSDKVRIVGRFQNREYVKHFADGSSEVRTAYEVSVIQLEEIWESEV